MGSSGEVNTALLGGNLDAAGLDSDVVSAGFIESEEFIPLATIGNERWDVTPDTPTLDELGYGDATLPDIYFYLATPNGIPDDVQTSLEEALKTCDEDPEVVDKMGGEDLVPDPFMGPDDVNEALKQHVETYTDYVDQ